MRTDLEALQARAKALHLNGLLAHWQEADKGGWVAALLDWEEQERARRGLERRLADAHIGRFKPLQDFDWAWPERCDRAAIEALMSLDFLKEITNVVLVAPNGLGKTMIAKNIAHQAVLHGHSVLFTTAGHMLGELAALDSDSTLRRRLRHYARPRLLVIDEVGYLSYSNRHADLLFELVSRRYEHMSTLITTNRPFSEWNAVFPKRRLCRLPRRSSHPSCRDPRLAGKVLPPQGSPGAGRAARAPAPESQVMTTPTVNSRFTFVLPDSWTPEQALAAAEFIGDLRVAIWSHYGEQLRDAYRELDAPKPGNKRAGTPDDTSF